MKRIVGLDTGRKNTKIYTDSFFGTFTSYIGGARTLKLERQLTRDDKIVTYNNESFFVGSIARDESYDAVQLFTKSKVIKENKILGLTAIHSAVNDGDRIHLVTSHPVTNHDQKQKDGMKNLFIGRHVVNVNDITKEFLVESVIVTPECACIQFLIPNIPIVAHGIDIGSCTTNFVTWIRGKWSDQLSGTLMYGTENSGLSLTGIAKKVVLDIGQRIQQFRGNVYVIGGVGSEISLLIQEYIPDQKVITLDNGLYANAIANYTIGVKTCENV